MVYRNKTLYIFCWKQALIKGCPLIVRDEWNTWESLFIKSCSHFQQGSNQDALICYVKQTLNLETSACIRNFLNLNRSYGVMVFNATFNNNSVISLWSVLLVEDTGVPGENHQPTASHWQSLSHNLASSTPHKSGIRTHNIGGDGHWLHR